jgi:hypothetical protein
MLSLCYSSFDSIFNSDNTMTVTRALPVKIVHNMNLRLAFKLGMC